MSSYGLAARFPIRRDQYRLTDPGAYEKGIVYDYKQNKAPFLSKCPRVTVTTRRLYTHKIYNASKPNFIHNITSMSSKSPRFPYESFKIEDFEQKLCECIEDVCECSREPEQKPEPICQANVPRRLFKGPVLQSSIQKSKDAVSDIPNCPPFYDARIIEATEFYRGCKWSRRTARQRSSLPTGPGPADYNLERKLTEAEICNEQFRAYRRKTSKQPRFIEIIQRRNLIDRRPGPSDYNNVLPNTKIPPGLGKAKSGLENLSDNPSPFEYSIKRLFDLAAPPNKISYCPRSAPACFGVKANRFTYKIEHRPSPASYDPRIKVCNGPNCSTAPFGTGAKRFKDTPLEESDDSDDESDKKGEECVTPTWGFKSRTVRLKPFIKKMNEPSPADFRMQYYNFKRNKKVEYYSPFMSSEGRFWPWHNWLGVNNSTTPGPGELDIEKRKTGRAVHRGPLIRQPRFRSHSNDNPAPNEYDIDNGLETVLSTYNERLKQNIEKRPQFKWQGSVAADPIPLEKREMILLQKTIDLLDDIDDGESTKVKKDVQDKSESTEPNQKLLRYFLYKHYIKKLF